MFSFSIDIKIPAIVIHWHHNNIERKYHILYYKNINITKKTYKQTNNNKIKQLPAMILSTIANVTSGDNKQKYLFNASSWHNTGDKRRKSCKELRVLDRKWACGGKLRCRLGERWGQRGLGLVLRKVVGMRTGHCGRQRERETVWGVGAGAGSVNSDPWGYGLCHSLSSIWPISISAALWIFISWGQWWHLRPNYVVLTVTECLLRVKEHLTPLPLPSTPHIHTHTEPHIL